jgi:hypothetical protein
LSSPNGQTDSLRSEKSDLVRACVRVGADAAEAFDRFIGDRDPKELPSVDTQLLPFVYRALADGDVDHPHRALLKRYYVDTWSTNNVLFRMAVPCLEHLSATGDPAVLLKGSAMSSDTYYADTGVRAMADVDILIDPDRLPGLVDWALETGWRPIWERAKVEETLAVSHAVGLHNDATGAEMDVHQALLGRDRSRVLDEKLIGSRVETTLGNGLVFVPRAEHMLVHALCHANASGLRNVVDAIHLIESPKHTIDWGLVTSEIIGRRSIVLALESIEQIRSLELTEIPSDSLDTLKSAKPHWSDLSHDQDVTSKLDLVRFGLARVSQVSRGSGLLGTVRTAATLAQLGVSGLWAARGQRDTN